ncbi:MAG: tetratricopeptide repeat protein [Planctomycetota bacterium]|jgi:tetratricopeptide (TPR) repeat protein
MADSGAVRFGIPAAVAVVAFLCFLPALGADFVNWDDPVNITENQHYRGLSPSHLAWMFTAYHGGHYMPLTWVSFGVDFTLWGMDPFGYHLVNVLLHAANAVLFYCLILILLQLAAKATEGGGVALRVAAAAGALFFAIHPLRVESVAWVTERRDVLSGLFFLLTLLAYLHMQKEKRWGGRWGKWFVISLAFCACSLLSKAWAVTIPAVLLIIDAYPLKRWSAWRTALLEKVPYAVLAVGVAVAALMAQRASGAMIAMEEHGVVGRTMQAAYGLCFYLWKTIAPEGLYPLYLLPRGEPLTGGVFLGCAALVAAVTVCAVVDRRRTPAFLASWVAYVVIASPVLGFLQSGPQIAADRYTYLACMPLGVLAAYGALALWRARSSVKLAAMVVPVSVGVLLVFGILTVRQSSQWKDSLSLWEHAVRVDPDNYYSLIQRGLARRKAGDLKGAVADYDRSIALNPYEPRVFYNRAWVRREQKDYPAAIADYTRTIELDPGHVGAYYNRGVVRGTAGDLRGAFADLTKVLEIAPPDWPHRGAVGHALEKLKQQGGDGR